MDEAWLRSALAEVVYNIDTMVDDLIVFPEGREELAAHIMNAGPIPDRHFLLVDIYLKT